MLIDWLTAGVALLALIAVNVIVQRHRIRRARRALWRDYGADWQ